MSLKLWFYDYDRTLCVHDYPKPGKQLSEFENICTHISCPEAFTKGDRPSFAMKWHMNKTDKEDKIFCLTHQLDNLRRDFIEKFLTYHYDREIKYLATATPELKIDMILAWANHYSVSALDCYLIDDRMDTVYNACEAGINGIHVSTVFADYERYLSTDRR